jgi:hypothetical protein
MCSSLAAGQSVLAIAAAHPYIAPMRSFGTILLLAALMALLAGSLWYAIGVWTELESADLPLEILLAMAGGIVFSLLVGVGLMALVFYSNRRGYDDRAGGRDAD